MNTQSATLPAASDGWLAALPRILRWPLLTLGAGLLVMAAWAVRHRGYYRPGDEVGYYMGLVGALMMLALLLYPLRKHLRILHNCGPVKWWFRLHMVCGIAGPLLVVFHSTFHVGSLNAAVAMYSMLLVAGSGVVGRFVYGRIHHGLYGRAATMQERERELGICADSVESKLRFSPEVEDRLRNYRELATRADGNVLWRSWRFMTLGARARWIRLQCLRAIRHSGQAHADAPALVAMYLGAVQGVAQFKAYEHMFSLWHVLHIPLVYTLAASAVFHAIAVHMY